MVDGPIPSTSFTYPKRMKPIIRKLHRYLGLIFSFSILMSSGSGISMCL